MILMTEGAADAGVPRRHAGWETLTGTCTKVTVMDMPADPAVCSDQVTTIRLGGGMIGFAFTISPPGSPKPWIMSFFADRSSSGSDKNAESLSVHRVYLTIDGKTDDLDATGSCVLLKKNRKGSAKFTCSVTTRTGNFAGDCTSNHTPTAG